MNYLNFINFRKYIKSDDCYHTKLKFIFYTCPETTLVFQKHFFKDLFSGKSAQQKFNDLRNAIFQYGYTSYDLS